MNKTEFSGMKHLPFHDPFPNRKMLFPPSSLEPVNRVACNGMARMGHVNPDLMGSTGLGAHEKKRTAPPQFLLLSPMGDGASPSGRRDGHLLSLQRMTANGQINDSLVSPHDSVNNRHILLHHFSRLELGGEESMGLIVLHHDHEA